MAAIQLEHYRFLVDHAFHRDEVKDAARLLVKLVQRHAKRGGVRAYLDSIHGYVPHGY